MERLNSRLSVLVLILILWFAYGTILSVEAKEPDEMASLDAFAARFEGQDRHAPQRYAPPGGIPAPANFPQYNPGQSFAVQASGVDVPILMYHKVADTATPCDEWWITKDLFELI